MQAEGLRGPLCWAVRLSMARGTSCSARIESGPAPASPTEEELDAANEYRRRCRREDLGLPQTATDAECEVAAGTW